VLTFPPLRSTTCLHMLRSRCGLRLKNWPKMTNDAGYGDRSTEALELSASLTTKGYLRRLLRRIGESHLVLDAYRSVQQSEEPKVLDRLRQNWAQGLSRRQS